jgi:hypothetical protein
VCTLGWLNQVADRLTAARTLQAASWQRQRQRQRRSACSRQQGARNERCGRLVHSTRQTGGMGGCVRRVEQDQPADGLTAPARRRERVALSQSQSRPIEADYKSQRMEGIDHNKCTASTEGGENVRASCSVRSILCCARAPVCAKHCARAQLSALGCRTNTNTGNWLSSSTLLSSVIRNPNRLRRTEGCCGVLGIRVTRRLQRTSVRVCAR